MQQQTATVAVWDPLIRLFHWLLAASFFTAYLLEDERLKLHLIAGSVIAGLIAFRFVWGFVGPEHARFADFLFSPRDILAHLGKLLRLRASAHIGHTPAGSVMIFLLITGLILLSITGIMLYGFQDGRGPMAGMMNKVSLDTGYMIEKLHGFIADVLAVLVLMHVGGVLVESLLQQQNLIKAMFTGRKIARNLEPSKEVL